MKIQFSRIAARDTENVTVVGLPEFMSDMEGDDTGYVEPFTPWSFITNYDGRREGDKWIYQETEMNMARLFIFDDPETGRSSYASMSFDGEFARYLPSGVEIEQIPEAGLKADQIVSGRIFGASQIGNSVYACGEGGKFVKREILDGWTSLDTGFQLSADELRKIEDTWALNNPEPQGAGRGKWFLDREEYIEGLTLRFTNLGGLREDSIYLVSQIPNQPPGRMHHWDGEKLTDIPNPSGEDINGFFFEDENRVWAYGRNGTILYGNHKDGFRDVSHHDDNLGLNGMGLFGGTMYLTSYAAETGLYMLDDNGRQVEVPDIPYQGSCTGLAIVEGALWTADDYAVLRFDGKAWDRIEHPQNVESQLEDPY